MASPLPRSFRAFIEGKARASAREAVRFDFREYQLGAAASVVRRVTRGENAIIDLPTGAGKTNVALLAGAQLTKYTHRGSKLLYVVPNRVLVDQVVRAASWLAPEVYRVAINDALTRSVPRVRAAVERADLIVSTPGLFASLLRRGALNATEFAGQLALTVVDEFDEFLTIDLTETGYSARCAGDFEELLDAVPASPLLLMSGTSPNKAEKVVQSFTASLLAPFVQRRFKPHIIAIPETRYRKHIPIAYVSAVPVHDEFVRRCDEALKVAQTRAFAEYQCEAGVWLDRDYLMERLAGIAMRSIRKVRLLNGTFRAADSPLCDLCRRLLSLVGKYTFLFEDMFASFSVEERSVPLIVDCVPRGRTILIPVLIDDRGDNQFWPQLRAKGGTLIELVKRQGDRRGVVFTRNVRLSDALQEALEADGIPTLKLDGRLSGAQRYGAIAAFQSPDRTRGVLLITRTTGKRGLDIPQADYAVVYSPKEDEYIMWQELSRIRSNVGKGKRSYVLHYDGTAESQKFKRLEDDMKRSANRYHFDAAIDN